MRNPGSNFRSYVPNTGIKTGLYIRLILLLMVSVLLSHLVSHLADCLYQCRGILYFSGEDDICNLHDMSSFALLSTFL